MSKIPPNAGQSEMLKAGETAARLARLTIPLNPTDAAPWLAGFSSELAVLFIEEFDVGGVFLVECVFTNVLEGITEDLEGVVEDALPRSISERNGAQRVTPTRIALACRNAIIEECARALEAEAVMCSESPEAASTTKCTTRELYQLGQFYELAALRLRHMLPGFADQWELKKRQFAQNCETFGFEHAYEMLRESERRSGRVG